MTAPQQQHQSLLDLEHTDRSDRRSRGPVTFSDDESLQRRLERRSTDRRRRERRGPAAQTVIADLDTRELCHDLRQPLASAVVLTHMLEGDAGLTLIGRQRLGLLHAELGRLAGMLTAHLEPDPPSLVDLAAVVRSLCRTPVEAPAAPVDLVVGPTPLVLGDPAQLSRLIANLIANARVAAGHSGVVRVHVGERDGAACIAVEDSGAASDEEAAPGFGLGLLIVDSVVRRHGGASRCTASELGGLRVSVTIPSALTKQDVGDHP